jgi:hypothetical protein
VQQFNIVNNVPFVSLKQKGRALLKNVPENIKDWLRSCAVEDHDLGFYDKFIKGTESNDKEEE